MTKEEEQIKKRYECDREEYLESKAIYDEVFRKKEIEKLTKKYVGKYFKHKDYNCYFFVKRITGINVLICDCITIDVNYVRIDFDYNEYLSIFTVKKSNKLEWTNALNMVMDRLKNFKNQ